MRVFGKYRGTVTGNADPLQLGRLLVRCPAVLGDGELNWAMPCVPYAGPGVGLFFLPPRGANVWVEFEGGDPNYPIWSGCFWGAGEVPVKPAVADTKVLKTDGVTLTINTLPGVGGFTIEVAPPATAQPLKLDCSAQGITMNFAGRELKLSLEGVQIEAAPASVKVAPAGVEISAAAATAKVAPGGVELGNGAASVKLSPVSVSINNGALEVT